MLFAVLFEVLVTVWVHFCEIDGRGLGHAVWVLVLFEVLVMLW